MRCLTYQKAKTGEPARPGQLPAGVVREIKLIQAVNERRTQTLSRYVGKTKATPLLTEILRALALAYAEDRNLCVKDIVGTCRAYGSARTIRNAVQTLADTGLAVFVQHEGDRRSVCLRPTQRVVDLYNSEVPWLRQEVMRLLREFPVQ